MMTATASKKLIGSVLPLALLFVSWISDPTKCDGSPADIVRFVALETQRVVIRWEVCTDELGAPYSCPVYGLLPWTEVANLATTSFQWADPEVGIGNVAFIRVEQLDVDARRSDEVCQMMSAPLPIP